MLAKNQSTKIVDINVLYVGSDYSITHIVAERLVAGATLEEGLLAFTDSSFGMERMIAVLTEAPAKSEMEDLSFLAQGGVPQQRRGVGDGAAGLLRHAARHRHGAGDALGDEARRQGRIEGCGDDLPDRDGAAGCLTDEQRLRGADSACAGRKDVIIPGRPECGQRGREPA